MPRSVVTGASTGIGFATALRLAREGHEVHASVRSLDSGAALLEAADGLTLSLLVMEVDDDASVSGAFSKLHDEHGPVDVLINNAGIAAGGAIEDSTIADFERVMNVNAWGTVRCVHAVLPSMRERGSGHIVNVTSLAGRVVQGSQGVYSASKFATEAITEALAIEARPFGIDVTAIEPGVIRTPIFSKGSGAPAPQTTPYVGARRMTELFRSSLMGHPGTPEMVADAIWRAVSGQDDRLRILVGDDAVKLSAARVSMTDEEWVERQADPDDDSFRAWIGGLSGVDVRPLSE